ncbi:hypothetical protein AB0H71_07985 [Nocardia sp. NPDC050697]|uniref:hypothetical protein n=1 Tax=Nocardia sp. NPDC050697 TaxID=3155158 RepID=UPI0033F5E16B
MEYLADGTSAVLRAELLGAGEEFNPRWLGAADRIVVPAEEIPFDMSGPFAARFLRALRHRGIGELLCFTAEELGAGYPEQAARCALDEVAGWRRAVGQFDAILVDENREHAVRLSADEYVLVAGDRAFVEAALGRTIATARADFRDYAADMAEASHHLPALADKYGC